MDKQTETKLEQSIAEWVVNFPKHPDPSVINSSLVNHQTYGIWKHIIRHVRPREEVWKIKANLEIKNGSVSQRRLELEKAIEARKREIAELERSNALLVQQIHSGQQKIIAKDTNASARKAKQLSFSRDVLLVRTHRSECGARAKEVEQLKDCLTTVQQNILPPVAKDDNSASVTDEVADLLQDFRSCLCSEINEGSRTVEGRKLAKILESYPHSYVAEVLKTQSRDQQQSTENYRRKLREEIQNRSPAQSLEAFECDVYELSTKIMGLWSLVRELEVDVIPAICSRRDGLKEELVRVMHDRLLLDEEVCRSYVDVGKDLAAKRGILDYFRGEIASSQATRQDVDAIEKLFEQTVQNDARLALAGKHLFELLHMTSSVLEEIAEREPPLRKMSELSSPTELTNSLVKEVEKTIAALSKLDTREEAKRRCHVKFSPKIFEVSTQKKVEEYLRERKNFEEFMKSSRLGFEEQSNIFFEVEKQANAAKAKLKKLCGHRDEMASTLPPLLKSQLEKTENERKIFQRCDTAVYNWTHEPAQDAILPHRVIDDLTFQEWKAKIPSLKYQPNL